MSTNESTPDQSDPRRYPQRPLLGVGALIFRDTSILLVERGKEPLKGYWSLPGGLLELGEKLEAAVQREVLEETGLVVEPLGLFELFERIMPDAQGNTEYHYVLADYICRVAGGTLHAASDVSDVRWVPRRDLSGYRLTEGTLAVIERAFEDVQR
jgi:ADP-ribose pyrophosphatase YjhB (NUDIX family)